VPLLGLISKKPPINRSSRLSVLADTADTWYAFKYPELCESFEPLLQERFPPWVVLIAKRLGIFRGWVFFLMSKKYSFTLTTATSQAANAFLLYEALLGAPRKHLIVIEFITRAKADSRSFLYTLSYLGPLGLEASAPKIFTNSSCVDRERTVPLWQALRDPGRALRLHPLA
jgi:hypothetical protein